MRFGLLCTVLLLCLAGTAHADAPAATTSKQELCLKDPLCRSHYAMAREFSKAGKLRDAIMEYEAAYAEVQIPVFLYNLGRLHQRLGNSKEAADQYRHFLQAALDDDQEQQARAREYLKELEAQSSASTTAPQPLATGPVADKPPVYKKWWFWTIVGTVAVGTAVGVGLGVGLRDRFEIPANWAVYNPSF